MKRQAESLDLIPSENVADPEMLRLVGSPLVNKYSEGYAGKRYYPGNEFYDAIENLAKSRSLTAFKLSKKEWSVNVQALSGSPANLAIYMALMKVGDTIMGLELSHGGHLTHGHKVSFSGKLYTSAPYTLDNDGYIDYENLERLAKKHKPKVIISGASAYPRIIDFKRIHIIAKKVGAYHVADISHIAGLVAVGVHPSPFPHADVVMTTTHKTLRGPRGAVIFSKKGLSSAIDKSVFPGLQGGPHNNVTAAIAWTFDEVQKPAFKKYILQVVSNAHVLADELMTYGFNLISGGTDTHLLLIDMKSVGLDGTKAESVLQKNNILANRNTIPNDASPFKPSGIRVGTPTLTARGMHERDMKTVAGLMYDCLLLKKNVKKEVRSLARRFPLPYKK